MNNKSLSLGAIGTIIWLSLVVLFAIYKDYHLPDSFNELGDALAGIVAPIAFFWLILGYIQQGRQLEQNSIAINQQAEALNFQIKEMKESVEQQKELANIQKQQLLESQKLMQAKFYIEDSRIDYVFFNDTNHSMKLEFKVLNLGSDVFDFKIRPLQSIMIVKKIDLFLNKDFALIEIRLELSDQEFEELNSQEHLLVHYVIEYMTRTRQSSVQMVDMLISRKKPSSYDLTIFLS